MDVPLPRLCTILKTIKFELVIPDKTAKIMRARAHIKPMTQAKPFYGFDIIWMHYQNDFRGLGVIPTPQADFFRK